MQQRTPEKVSLRGGGYSNGLLSLESPGCEDLSQEMDLEETKTCVIHLHFGVFILNMLALEDGVTQRPFAHLWGVRMVV